MAKKRKNRFSQKAHLVGFHAIASIVGDTESFKMVYNTSMEDFFGQNGECIDMCTERIKSMNNSTKFATFG